MVSDRTRAAIADITEGFGKYHIWITLGWNDVLQRYRRSKLGPFWITLSIGVMVVSMGLLYARILGQDLKTYLPYLAVGLVLWNFMASLITDGCSSFIQVEAVIKQIRLPVTLHVLRMIWRNAAIFAHNVVVVILVLLWFSAPGPLEVLSSLLGLLLIAFASLPLGILLGMICARFRDVPQIVASLLQVAFFMTPVLWNAQVLGSRAWIAHYNPLFHYFEIVRSPLLGGVASPYSWIVAIGVTILLWVAAFAFLVRFRSRVSYWV